MGREIKFRAYIKSLKWLLPVEDINFSCKTVEIDLTDGNGDTAEYEFDEIELMQFTELFDDFGTEIFEGDIVEIQDSTETKTSYESPVCITHAGALVNHHPAHVSMGEFGMRNLSAYCDYGHGGKYNVRCKIVGNIHKPNKQKGGEE